MHAMCPVLAITNKYMQHEYDPFWPDGIAGNNKICLCIDGTINRVTGDCSTGWSSAPALKNACSNSDEKIMAVVMVIVAILGVATTVMLQWGMALRQQMRMATLTESKVKIQENMD